MGRTWESQRSECTATGVPWVRVPIVYSRLCAVVACVQRIHSRILKRCAEKHTAAHHPPCSDSAQWSLMLGPLATRVPETLVVRGCFVWRVFLSIYSSREVPKRAARSSRRRASNWLASPQPKRAPRTHPDDTEPGRMEPEDFIAGEHSDAVRPMLAPPRGPKLEPEAEESDTEDQDADELDESFQSTATSNNGSANGEVGSVTEYLREQACRSTPHPAGGIARTSGGLLTTTHACITGPLHADRNHRKDHGARAVPSRVREDLP